MPFLGAPVRLVGHASALPAAPPDFTSPPGLAGYLCGASAPSACRQPQCGLDVFTAAQSLGGHGGCRATSLALTDLFIQLVEERYQWPGRHHQREHALDAALDGCPTARDEGAGREWPGQRCAYAIVQALIVHAAWSNFHRAGWQFELVTQKAGKGDGGKVHKTSCALASAAVCPGL